MKKIISMIINELLKRGIIKEENSNLYEYGMNVLIMNCLPILIILTVSIILNEFIYGFVFLIAFIPIRINIGGFHCSKMKNCLIIFTLIFIGSVLIKNQVRYSIIKRVGEISIILFFFIEPITYSYLENYDDNLLKAKKRIKLICILLIMITQQATNESYINAIYIASAINIFLYGVGVYDLRLGREVYG